MSGDAEAAHVSDTLDAAQVISPDIEPRINSGDKDMQLLIDAVRSLPSHAVKDLLSNGVCMRCIFRLFGLHGHVYFCSSIPLSVTHTILRELTQPDKQHMVGSCVNGCGDSSNPSMSEESEVEPELCSICLGILQFTYRDDKEMLVKKQNANNLAVCIAELVKQEGHQIDSFSLEVSIPPIILENERSVQLYMKKKYGSEIWFQERISECISTKDALKLAIANPLDTLLDVKSRPSSYRIRFTYTQTKPSSVLPNSVEWNEVCKRRKTAPSVSAGTNCGLDTVIDELIGYSTIPQGNAAAERSVKGLVDCESSECFNFPVETVNEPCHLVFLCYRTPIYFGGRYLKFSRNVSQTRWIIDDERMGEASVEEIVGGNILPICQGDAYKFHAAGREDIDVRMLGSGRPFLVEIQNARQVPSKALVEDIETKINNLENQLVGVKNLKVVNSDGWTLMHEGEAEKQKQYCALVWISRPLEDEDFRSVASLQDMQILQRTPIRVLHRRSPLEREKIIHWMKIERIAGSSQYFLLHLCTQAGTYIKEFVHGDLGRTHPSIGSILGCRAEILQLDVTDVKMDCFLAE